MIEQTMIRVVGNTLYKQSFTGRVHDSGIDIIKLTADPATIAAVMSLTLVSESAVLTWMDTLENKALEEYVEACRRKARQIACNARR